MKPSRLHDIMKQRYTFKFVEKYFVYKFASQLFFVFSQNFRLDSEEILYKNDGNKVVYQIYIKLNFNLARYKNAV